MRLRSQPCKRAVLWVWPQSSSFHKWNTGLAPSVFCSVLFYLTLPISCLCNSPGGIRSKQKQKGENAYKIYLMIWQSKIFNCLVDSIVIFGLEGGGEKGWEGCWGNTSELGGSYFTIGRLCLCWLMDLWQSVAPISSWPLPGFRCLPGVFRDAGQTAVHRASFSFRSEKGESVGLRASQGINPVAGESERTHTTREGSPCWDLVGEKAMKF